MSPSRFSERSGTTMSVVKKRFIIGAKLYTNVGAGGKVYASHLCDWHQA